MNEWKPNIPEHLKKLIKAEQLEDGNWILSLTITSQIGFKARPTDDEDKLNLLAKEAVKLLERFYDACRNGVAEEQAKIDARKRKTEP